MKAEILERARTHILRQGPSISGSYGHRQAFYVALLAVRHWALSDAEALDLLTEWNRSCQPPWSQRDLERKIEQARKAGKSSAPIGCLADKAMECIGGGDAALARWKAKRMRSDASDARKPLLTYTGTILSRTRKVIESSVRSVRNSQATGVNVGEDQTRGEQGHLLAQTGPRLIPLESPWRDGARYREAGAIEVASRLDCYLEDDTGDWVRRHGVLIARNQ